MAHFGKFANLSHSGWTEKTATQLITIGNHAHIGLWGGGPAGEELIVKSETPAICVAHEESRPSGREHWRHFVLTALQDGETRIIATLPSGATWASMIVRVTGRVGVRFVFFPGERRVGSTVQGTIYVVGGKGETMSAAGGPPAGRADRGGHTVEPTPPGHYVLGPRIHVVSASWPNSVIPFGAALRVTAGEVEYEVTSGHWKLATGPRGSVTAAQMAFLKRDGLHPTLTTIAAQVRNVFLDSSGNLRSTTWKSNDFGRWGWNLLRGGQRTPYFVHTTPDDEHASDLGRAVFLTNSHGCVHLVPAERDRLMAAGYLKQGVPFEVRPYTETGPP